MGEVAGRPEQDQDRRIRDALEAQALAQDVLDRLRARGALALAGEAQLLHRQRRVLGPRRRACRDRLVGRRLDRGGVLATLAVVLAFVVPPGRRHDPAATRS